MKAPTWLAKLIIDVVDEEELLTPTPSSCIPQSATYRAKSRRNSECNDSGSSTVTASTNGSGGGSSAPRAAPKRQQSHGFTPAVVSPRTELATNLWVDRARAQLEKLSEKWTADPANFHFNDVNDSFAPKPQPSVQPAAKAVIAPPAEKSHHHQNKFHQVPRDTTNVPSGKSGPHAGKRSSPKPVNTKTILCKYYLKGNCVHGASCSFAHGEKELLVTDQDRRNQRHEKLKTKPCKNLHGE